MYINLRATKNLKVSNASAELLLFVLQSSKLNEEVIDFCSISDEPSQIKSFYLGEALMQMKLKNG